MVLATVIVPTRNRASALRRCLQSMTRQTLPAERFEIVVVDNGSTDDTAAVAKSFDNGMALSLLHEPEPGLHVGRHAGWRAARSDLLVFVDDDIEADPGWLAAVVDSFSDPLVALVGGNNLPAFEAEPPAWLRRWWERPVGQGRALGYLSILDFGRGSFEIDPGYVWGCNFGVRASVLEESRGFHPDGVPRERLRFRGDGETHVADVVRRRGHRAWFHGAATVHHLVDVHRMKPAYFEERAFAQGVSDSYAMIRARGGRQRKSPDIRGLLRGALDPARAWWTSGGWNADAVARELRAVETRVRQAYHRGREFHLAEVLRDRALLDWVLREDYLP
jgi:glycosyltransferase involved in cell wall biosynthesis